MSAFAILYCYHCSQTDFLYITDCLHIICEKCRLERLCAVCQEETDHRRVDTDLKEQLLMDCSNILRIFSFQKTQMLNKISKLEKNEKMYKLLIERCKTRITQQKAVIERMNQNQDSLLCSEKDMKKREIGYKKGLPGSSQYHRKEVTRVPKSQTVQYDSPTKKGQGRIKCRKQEKERTSGLLCRGGHEILKKFLPRSNSHHRNAKEWSKNTGSNRTPRRKTQMNIKYRNTNEPMGFESDRERRGKERTSLCEKYKENGLERFERRDNIPKSLREFKHNPSTREYLNKKSDYRVIEQRSFIDSENIEKTRPQTHKIKNMKTKKISNAPDTKYKSHKTHLSPGRYNLNSSPEDNRIFNGYSDELRKNPGTLTDFQRTPIDIPLPSSKCSLLHRLARRKNEILNGRGDIRISMGILGKRPGRK